MPLSELKLWPQDLPALIVSQQEAVARKRKLVLAGMVVVATVVVVVVTQIYEPVFAGFALILLGAMGFGYYRKVGRKLHKLDFATELIGLIGDDLHPGRKLHFDLDQRAYSASDKKTWSGRSMHGNPKHRYEDHWLTMRFSLADGSAVTLRRHAEFKTKKGNIVKEKRRLKVKVRPSRQRYAPLRPAQARKLEGDIREHIQSSLHDPPEGLSVDISDAAGKISVGVMQLDAPILPVEVCYVLEAIIGALARQRTDR